MPKAKARKQKLWFRKGPNLTLISIEAIYD